MGNITLPSSAKSEYTFIHPGTNIVVHVTTVPSAER